MVFGKCLVTALYISEVQALSAEAVNKFSAIPGETGRRARFTRWMSFLSVA